MNQQKFRHVVDPGIMNVNKLAKIPGLSELAF